MENSAMTPQLCAKGCGFFGSPATRNLCSKCYNDYLKEEASKHLRQEINRKQLRTTPAALVSPPTNPFPWTIKASAIEKEADDIINSSSTAGTTATKSNNRCVTCKKKVPLPGFKCRCGELFCGEHRYPETHGCEKLMEYKEKGRASLAKQNPLIMADKCENRV